MRTAGPIRAPDEARWIVETLREPVSDPFWRDRRRSEATLDAVLQAVYTPDFKESNAGGRDEDLQFLRDHWKRQILDRNAYQAGPPAVYAFARLVTADPKYGFGARSVSLLVSQPAYEYRSVLDDSSFEHIEASEVYETDVLVQDPVARTWRIRSTVFDRYLS